MFSARDNNYMFTLTRAIHLLYIEYISIHIWWLAWPISAQALRKDLPPTGTLNFTSAKTSQREASSVFLNKYFNTLL